MPRAIASILTLVLAALAAADGRAGDACCFDPGHGSSWADDCCDSCCTPYGSLYFQLDALYFTRDNRGSRDVVIRVTDEATPAPGTTVLTTGSTNYDWQPGYQALFGVQLGSCHAFEFSYFGIYNWHGSAIATGDNDLAIPGDLGLASLDYFAADRMRLDSQSNLHNAEVNYLVAFSDALSLLGGFRYVALSEEFNIRSTDADTGTSNYNTTTSNNLFGGQLGFRWLRSTCNWDWIVTGKAGLFGNESIQRQFVEDFPPPFLLRDAGPFDSINIAFVSDFNLTASYFINDLWSLRAGYNLLFIEGVALAPNQLDFTDTPDSGTGLITSGGFFAHGVNLGVQASW